MTYFSVQLAGGDTRLVGAVAGIDPRVSWSDPLIGEWWIDPGQCYYDRPLPFPPDPGGWTPLNRTGARPTSGAGGIGVGKWTYVPEGDGVRSFYYFGNGPDSGVTPMMQYFATWDGTPWADPHSTLLPGQLAQVWRLDPRLAVRLVLDNNSPVLERWEWAVWAASTDARVMACTSWDSSAPDRHNLQVFDKHLGPTYDSRGAGVPAPSPSGATAPLEGADRFLGAWRLEAERSSFLRAGQDIAEVRPAAIAHRQWRFAAEGDGLRLTISDPLGSADVTDTLLVRFDGVERSGPSGVVACWRISDELIVSRADHGGDREWTLYALSRDGESLAVTNWDERAPQNRDIQVFRRT